MLPFFYFLPIQAGGWKTPETTSIIRAALSKPA
jgi:hypothetical protein